MRNIKLVFIGFLMSYILIFGILMIVNLNNYNTTYEFKITQKYINLSDNLKKRSDLLKTKNLSNEDMECLKTIDSIRIYSNNTLLSGVYKYNELYSIVNDNNFMYEGFTSLKTCNAGEEIENRVTSLIMSINYYYSDIINDSFINYEFKLNDSNVRSMLYSDLINMGYRYNKMNELYIVEELIEMLEVRNEKMV